jgi:tetratricopeptide (TPR) repeat protein
MTAVPILLGFWMLAQAPLAESCAGEGAVDCWLAAGLTRVFASKVEVDPARRQTLLNEAAQAFEQALALDPVGGAALNNLAQVDADLGRDSDAEPLFERAVALDDPLRPFYRRNFGDFLAARGQWDRAISQYRATLEEQISDLQAHESLTAILSQHRPESIPDYLRFLLDRGQVIWAEEVALSRLQAAPTEEYLSFLAQARAEQGTPPDELLPEAVVDILKTLIDQPRIGEGAKELLLLREGGDFEPSSFSWWADRGGAKGAAGPSPRQAFRSLARSFGDSQRQAGRAASARDYYQLAVLLAPEEPDLVSFRRMLELPSATEDVQTIDRLADLTERNVWNGTSRTEVYRYRHDLGLHYAGLQRWMRCLCPTSAIFQLEKAVRLVDVTGPPGSDPPFDPRIYFELAWGYLATDRASEASAVLHDVAEIFEDRGEPAGHILSTVTPAGPDRASDSDFGQPNEPIFEPMLRDFTTPPPRPPCS